MDTLKIETKDDLSAARKTFNFIDCYSEFNTIRDNVEKIAINMKVNDVAESFSGKIID